MSLPGIVNVSSKNKFIGRNTIFDGSTSPIPYMTRSWIGRLRYHVFHRGDLDDDCHTHPWGFVTFPFNSYVEEYLIDVSIGEDPQFIRRYRVVEAWRFHRRSADFAHRVLGRWSGIYSDIPESMLIEGKIRTIVWRDKDKDLLWGFWVNAGMHWCWKPFREYFNGGKYVACKGDDE